MLETAVTVADVDVAGDLAPDSAPAMIEHRKEDVSPNRFVPDTRLVITAALRTSGLLADLSDREARTLLAVLTFLNPNGRFTGTALDIASALGLPDGQSLQGQKAIQERLRALMALSFRGAPVLVEVPRAQALPIYVPGPHIVRHVQEEPAGTAAKTASAATVNRESLLSLNREKYTRPREEVERDILAQLGHDPGHPGHPNDPNDLLESAETPEGDALRRMLSLGVAREEAKRLLSSFPLAEIQQQIDWLPQRDARSPARFLVAAIEKRYDPPASDENP